MDDLTAFVKARLDEDEAMAKAALESVRGEEGELAQAAGPCVSEAGYLHIARHDPARALREVAAKRAIVRWHPSEPMRNIDASRCPQCELTWPCPTIRVLAAVYSGHPDYRREWAP